MIKLGWQEMHRFNLSTPRWLVKLLLTHTYERFVGFADMSYRWRPYIIANKTVTVSPFAKICLKRKIANIDVLSPVSVYQLINEAQSPLNFNKFPFSLLKRSLHSFVICE
jgi:hypothetical protein